MIFISLRWRDKRRGLRIPIIHRKNTKKMGKVKGIIQFTGSFDGITFYKRKGTKGTIVRKTGGFTGEAIKTKASMAPVRNNANELGAVSVAVRLFKLGIAPLMPPVKIGDFHSRLVSLFMKIKGTDMQSAKGSRNVADGLKTEEGRSFLLGHPLLYKTSPKYQLFKEMTYDAATRVLHYTGLDKGSYTFPKGSDAIQFQAGLLWLDFASEVSKLTLSEVVVQKKGSQEPFAVTFPEDVDGTGVCLVVFSVNFLEVYGDGYRGVLGVNGGCLEVVGLEV